MREQISTLQLIFILLWLVMSTGYMTLPYAIGQFTTSSGWMVAFSFLIGIGVVAVVVILFTRTFPKQTLTEGFKTSLGPIFGTATGVIFLVVMYLFLCLLIRELVGFLDTSVLPVTPTPVLAGLLTITFTYASYLGIENITRLAEIVTPVVVLTTLALLLLSTQHANFHHLQPLMPNNMHTLLRASVVAWMFSLEFIYVLSLAPTVNNPSQIIRAILVTGGLLSLGGLGIEVILIAVLGPQIGYTTYPLLEVVRTVEYGRFFERLDPLYVMAVLSTVFIKISAVHNAFASEIKRVFGLKHQKFVVLSSAMSIWAGSQIFFRNMTDVVDYVIHSALAYNASTLIGLPVFAVAVFHIRKHLLHQNPIPTSPPEKK